MYFILHLITHLYFYLLSWSKIKRILNGILQVLVERFGLVARFGFMHLTATNLALWARLVVWESGNEWTYFVYLAQSVGGVSPRSASYDIAVPTPLQLKGFPRSVTEGAGFRMQRDLRYGMLTFYGL